MIRTPSPRRFGAGLLSLRFWPGVQLARAPHAARAGAPTAAPRRATRTPDRRRSWARPPADAVAGPERHPGPSASPTPGPSDGASGCSAPLPPELSRININIHQRGDNHWLLDSTPIVGPDVGVLCQDWLHRWPEPVPRPHGRRSPARGVRALHHGRATDTGRPGPTWSVQRQPVHGTASLREQPGQSVPGHRVSGWHLPGLRQQERRLRRVVVDR
jgi:hypothetical protein